MATIAIGVPTAIQVRRRPKANVVRSESAPISGSVSASNARPIANISPTVASDSPATCE